MIMKKFALHKCAVDHFEHYQEEEEHEDTEKGEATFFPFWVVWSWETILKKTCFMNCFTHLLSSSCRAIFLVPKTGRV